MSITFKKVFERARELQTETARFLCNMVQVPSFSTKENEVVEVVAREMRKEGFDDVRVDGIGNIIGRIGNGKRLMAFDAHLDTVKGGARNMWSFDPYSPKIEEGKVWGRGAVDQKSGMASMVYAGKMIKELGLNKVFTVIFTGTIMEEDCDGLCWQYIINKDKIIPELVIITEPTNMNINRGHRGRMEIRAQLTGRTCHGSAPERGENAIYKAARLTLELERLNQNLADHPFLGKGTIAVTEIKSTSPSLCAVPDAARLHLDRRLTVGETKESAMDEVREATIRAGCPETKVEIIKYEEKSYTGLSYPVEKYYPTWVLDEDSPYLKIARIVYCEIFGKEPFVDKWTFSTNGVAIAGMYNIPCFGLGPGNEIYAHAPDEACPIDQLSSAAAFYAALVAKLNGII